MRARVLLLAFVGVVCAVLLSTGSALALNTHVFSTSFGSAGSGAGQVRLASAIAEEGGGSGLAVNSVTHDVYVADTGNFRVDEFSSTGVFVRAWGWGVADGLPAFEVCTLSCQQGISGSGAGQFANPLYVAVDNSAGLSAGDVYVGDTADNVVTKFSAIGALIGTWGSGGQLNGSTATGGPFGLLAGITVDGAGTLDVFDTNTRMFEFAQDGTFSTDFSTVRGTIAAGLAVNSLGDFFKVNGNPTVEEFDGSGGQIGQVTQVGSDGRGHTTGLALDPSGNDLYVDNGGGVVDHYESSCVPDPADSAGCAPTDSFGVGSLSGAAGLAVDSSSQTVFAADAGNERIDIFTGPVIFPDVVTGSASNVLPHSATLNGTVNPDGVLVSDCHFNYGTSTAYGQSAPCAETVGAGTGEVSVHADVGSLTPDTTYHFRLVASNANGTNQGADATFSTPPPPSIENATAKNVTGVSADLTASVNPHGQDTIYRFEWGKSTGYGTTVPVPDGDAGTGTGSVPVTAHLSGLSGDTTYHWRVVAQNASGTITTSDHTFIYSTAGGTLPDGRAYEMVTPPHKNGALIGDAPIFGIPTVLAEDGSRVIATSIQCFAGAGSCNAERNRIGSSYEFSRTGTGWVTTPLSLPATQFSVSSPLSFSADGGTALFSAPTSPGGEDDIYGRELDGSVVHVGPLTSPAAGAVGASFGTGSATATVDLSHVVWETHLAGLFTQWPFDATLPTGGYTGGSVYEYVGAGRSQPLLVGVNGGSGSTDLVSVCGTREGGEGRKLGAVSSDGRTVFFTAKKCASGSGVNAGVPVPGDALYARVDESRTVAISGRSPAGCTGGCQSSPPGDALFEAASRDGSRVLFTSTQQLMDSASEDSLSSDSATNSPNCAGTVGMNGCNLYLYDSANPAGHELVDVSAGDSSGGGPRVQGVMAFSPDGSHIYFVAKGVLTKAANAQGQSAQDGENNLYVFERDASNSAGRLAFIAALPAFDFEEWSAPDQPANVTPDGRFLVFASSSRLTADDTSLSGARQVFRYDARTDALVRISIGNDGFGDNGNRSGPTPCNGGVGCSEDATIAFSGYGRSDMTMSNDGSFVFFRSPVGLTPRALDDVQVGTFEAGLPEYAENVYEWHEGHVYLISDGRDVSRNHGADLVCYGGISGLAIWSSVCLLGVDESGRNVFFTTADQLVGQDVDTELDYYDARVCTAGDPCIPSASPAPAGCEGDACHGTPPATPGLAGVATVTFNGPGNVAPPSAPVAHKKPVVKKPVVKKKHVKRKRHAKHLKGKRAKAHRVPRAGRRGKGGHS